MKAACVSFAKSPACGATRRYRIALIEFSGIGGVFDSTAALGDALTAAGHDVELIAPRPAEGCAFRWPIRSCQGAELKDATQTLIVPRRVRPRALRLVAFFCRSTLISASCTWRAVRCARSADLVSVQGRFIAPIVALVVIAARSARHAVVAYTPHNTFSRRSGLRATIEQAWIRLACRVAHAVVLHTRQTASIPGVRNVAIAPLLPLSAVPAPVRRNRISETPTLLTPGFIRRDKGVLPFAEAVAASDYAVRYRVVGYPTDERVAVSLRRLGDRRISAEFRLLDSLELGAEIAAADVVVLPYERSSGSGILETAVATGAVVCAFPFAPATEWARMGAAVFIVDEPDPAELLRVAAVVIPSTPDLAERVACGVDLARGRRVLAANAYAELVA